jgi:hypothetical protein
VNVQALQPRGIRDYPLRDPAETPYDQPAADADREQGDGGGYQDGDKLRQLPLQPPLQWPYQRDDEQGEGYRDHHTVRQRQGCEREDDGAGQRRKP